MKRAVCALALAALMTSAAWAGTMGNGHQQRTAAYAYCYGGIGKVEYFSKVFLVRPGENNGGVAFGKYLTSMGYRNDGGLCRGAPTEGGAIADKKQSEDTFRSAEYHHRQIVETEWPSNA
jgi:hypothetical protein